MSKSSYMGRVAALPCVACGADGVHVHHMRGCRRNAYLTMPLCPSCHQGEFSIHMDRRNFEAVHGSELQMLAKTIERLHCG